MNLKLPEDYFMGFKENWKVDILSGFTIFLIALPLCIGIALASGAPPIAGLLSGIIGGLIVSLFSSSRLAIHGPAAGLIVIVLASVEDLGGGDIVLGFKYTLVAIFLAGILQIIMGFFRTGIISFLLPYDVVHGMLCGIGIIIISKQIHAAFGVVPDSKAILDLLYEIPTTFKKANPYVTIISMVSFFILIGMMKIKQPRVNKIPASLIVVIIAILLAEFFSFQTPYTYYLFGNEYVITPKLLVQVPDNFLAGMVFPDFTILKNPKVYVHALTIALVASIESILTATAVDQMNPSNKKTNMNQELIANGIGNSILGLIGGLPIIAEVVRSSANFNNGAKTRWANFTHGFFLFLFVVFFPFLIHKIPVSALSALLVVVGYRLSAPEIRMSFKNGADHLVVFFVTVFFILTHDLLFGIGMGLSAKFILHVVNVILPVGVSFNDFFHVQMEKTEELNYKEEYAVYGILVFSNILSFKFQMDKLNKERSLVLDLGNLRLIDRTFLTYLDELQKEFQTMGGNLELKGLAKLRPMNEAKGSARKLQRPDIH